MQNDYKAKTKFPRYGHYDSYVDQREQYLELLARLTQSFVPHYSYDADRREELSQWLFKLPFAEVKRRRNNRLWSVIYDVESGKHELGDSDYQRYLEEQEQRFVPYEERMVRDVEESVMVDSGSRAVRVEEDSRARMLRLNAERKVKDDKEREKIKARVERYKVDEEGEAFLKHVIKSNEERKKKDDAEWKKYEEKYIFKDVSEDEDEETGNVAKEVVFDEDEMEQIRMNASTESEKNMVIDAVRQFDAQVAAGWRPSDSDEEKDQSEKYGCKSKKRKTVEERRQHEVCFERDWVDNEEAEKIRAERMNRRTVMIDSRDIVFAKKGDVTVDKPVVVKKVVDRALSPIEVAEVNKQVVKETHEMPSRSEDLRLKSYYEQQMEDMVKRMKDELVLEDIRKRRQFEEELKAQLISETARFKDQYKQDVLDELKRESENRKLEVETRRLLEQQRSEEHEQRERLRRRGVAGRPIVQRDVINYESNITDSLTENQINQREGKI